MPLDRISFSPRSSGLYVLLMPDTTWAPMAFSTEPSNALTV
jgi:hypothetical protein